ncbi:MAG: threonine--tRNA ligase, partial [Spirochaetaceae bacterium]|nr:threonine--tRNA ligase [Spirochaetaceae bacterium]
MSAQVETIRHSASHIMAQAVQRLYPGTKVGIGPAIEDGFYYDFLFAKPLLPDELPAIEKEMRRIISANPAFVRKEVSKDEARKLFADEPFKLELIDGL